MAERSKPSKQSRPSEATRATEREDAKRTAGPDRQPNEEEIALTEDLEVDPDTREHYKEMAERGAKQRGEGRLP